MAFQQMRLLALTLMCFSASVLGHTPLTVGPTKAPRYSTWKNALTIPTNKISLAARRIQTCGAPFFWLKFTGKKGDRLLLATGTSGAAALKNVRTSVLVFGPGLPKRTKKFSFDAPNTKGALLVKGPKSVSSCGWLPKEQKAENSVINGRCGRMPPNVIQSYFPLLFRKWRLPASGTFHFAFHTQGQYSGRYYISTGSWEHSHAEVELPTPPKGNAGSDTGFWTKKATSVCCVKGASTCPATPLF